MEMHYTVAENTQILISLLKQYGVHKIIASPGTMNVNFIGSVQNDDFFQIYSCVDERSAAYMACGMAAESGEYVCLSCTGATASRNYIPGLTEAFYRKLPIVAITATQRVSHIGHNMEQVIDRRTQLNDMVRYSALIPVIHDEEDRWECIINVNKALIEAKRHGGGPVHINLEVDTLRDFSVKNLPKIKKIEYLDSSVSRDNLPVVPDGRVAVFVGNHKKMSSELETAITRFCEKYDAVVFCDRTSNYLGKYRISPGIVIKQDTYTSPLLDISLLIHLGDVSGAQYKFKPKTVWRVNPDGEIRDTYKRIRCIFEMEELDFFKRYTEGECEAKDCYFNLWKEELLRMKSEIPNLPFSNVWIAQYLNDKIPYNSIIHMGILNSLRSWDYFDSFLEGYSNTGAFGIDGGVSSMIGGALACPDKLHFGFFGDLAFFYDMNSLGNRHLPDNIRILLVNNGKGVEFRKYYHPANRFGEDADLYMAAAGHFGNKSLDLVKHYSEDLGFDYISASNKQEFEENVEKFLSSQNTKPILFENFVMDSDDNTAIKQMQSIEKDIKGETRQILETMMGDRGYTLAKKFIKG